MPADAPKSCPMSELPATCSAEDLAAFVHARLQERPGGWLFAQAFVDALCERICLHCGRPQPKNPPFCQCWNDE